MAPSFVQSGRALARYLARVARRALWFKLIRGGALAAGTSAALLLAFALLAGPSASRFGALLTWSTIVAAAGLAGVFGLGSLADLRGARRARLLSAASPELAARVRSAAELTASPNGSGELIAALARDVTSELSRVPLAHVVPRPPRFRALSALGLGVALAAGLLLAAREDAAAGLYALLHPGSRDEQGQLVGLWVSGLRAHLTYPERFPVREAEVANARVLHVPEGTVIDLVLSPRVAVERAVLKLGEHTLPYQKREDGKYTLTLTAERSARMELKARVSGAWISDPVVRTLGVENDAAPVVELLAPLADQHVDEGQRVPFSYRVRDDHGLDGVDLVVQLGPNRERRLRLTSYPAQVEQRVDEGSTDVAPAAFGARAGQTLAVWIEARDRDSFGGANVGRSPVRTITVGEAAESGGPELELLRAARDLALDALGERLETPLGEGTRARKLARKTRELVSALSTIADESETGNETTKNMVRDMTRRLSRLLREEADKRGDEATAHDEKFVAELEEDVLWLSDLLGRAKLDAAQGALDRLAATRARMRKLLEQLKKSDDPSRRAELMAEIARARSELRDILERMSEAENDVPSDFVNYEALRREAGDNPLEELERALAAGDMNAAERALSSLDQRMASLERGLEGGGNAFRSARFAERQEALERARGELNELEHGQEQLAKETDKVAARAKGRAGEHERAGQNERLAQQSEALERRTRKLEAGQVQPAVGDAQDNAAQRLRDARDALRQGESGEARNMAERAASDLEALAMEMRLDARMYPGRDGSRMNAAREAEQLARDVSRFADEVEASAPREPEQLSHDEREALRKQAPNQRTLGERAGKLASEARERGPSTMRSGLERAREAMRAAENALERGDLEKSRADQRDALDRLRETSQELERQARASSGDDGPRDGKGQAREGRDDEKVLIPEGATDTRRSELRRRVLDARRAETPASFERSVERYYQEILR